MTFPDHFSGHAPLYAASRPTYPPSLIGEIAALAPGRAQAWDVGTGNGQSALLLAEHFASVFASDASASQIAEAKPLERVIYAVEPAERCSLSNASCDLILAAQCFHWFDHPSFYEEAQRVLRPGGLLAVIGYGWWYVDEEIDAIVATLLKRLEPHWLAGNWMLIDGYRGVALPGTEVRLPPAAMHLRWQRTEIEAYVRSWSVIQRLGEEVTADAFARLREVWPDGETRHVVMPLVSRAARL
jgi:SAM-dependent methyltransferase